MTQCQFQTILTGGLSQNPCHLHKLNYVPFLDKSCYLVPFGDTSDLAHARNSLFQRKSVGCLPAISTGNIWSLSVLVFLNFSSWHTQPQGSLSNLSAGCWKNQVIATLLRTSVFNGRMSKKISLLWSRKKAECGMLCWKKHIGWMQDANLPTSFKNRLWVTSQPLPASCWKEDSKNVTPGLLKSKTLKSLSGRGWA